MAFIKPTSKTTAKPVEVKKDRPVKSLSVKEAGSEEAVPVCGLFEAKTKKGDVFYKGSSKETKQAYAIFPAKEGYRLVNTVKDAEGKFKYDPICNLEVKTSKKGMEFMTGKDAEGNEFLVFPVTPKS